MHVKFLNQHVHVYKLRKGAIVEFADDYYHIKHVHKTQDRRVVLVLKGAYEELEVNPAAVTWLES